MRRRQRIAVLGTLVAISIVGGATSALAGIAGGGFGYYTVSGVDYKNLSVIHTSSPDTSPWAFAETDVIPINTAVGEDWISGNARLFNSSGQLLSETGFESNPTTIAANGVWDVFGTYRRQAGSYVSYGVTKAWTGSTYVAYCAFQTSPMNTGT